MFLMAQKWFLIACVAAIWAVDLGQAASSSHHAHAPSPSLDCTTLAATNLVDCLTFVTKDSTITKPQGTCCSGLKSILNTAPNCLCEAFKNSAQFGIDLNVTKALTLPAACKLSTPSVANCALSLTPAAAPGLSPAASSATVNELTPAGAPSPSPGNSASALIPFSAGSLILCLLVALFGPPLIPF